MKILVNDLAQSLNRIIITGFMIQKENGLQRNFLLRLPHY